MATSASAHWFTLDRFTSAGRAFIVLQRSTPSARTTCLDDPSRLTHRERQVLRYALEGQPNKIAAFELGIAVSTVAMHLAHAASKLGVRRRVDLLNLCLELGWSGDEP